MSAAPTLAFLFDVDNTLLDYDQVKADLYAWLGATLGADAPAVFRRNYEGLREQLGYADFLASFQRCWQGSGLDPRWLGAARFLLDYPFHERLYPGALAALEHVGRLGQTAIVSDGEAVLQPRKIRLSGIHDAVAGRVLVYQHKDRERDDIRQRIAADLHVMVDDKLSVLTAMKRAWGASLVTVFVRQGHYAREQLDDGLPAADFSIDQIHQLTDIPPSDFLQAAARRSKGD
ncbi:MAG TPA: HAD family hydrolase [Rhodanobacteraceae bacterium]|nr:HAD family hydrolase [Rhodanobacteraceae bacterium]